MRKQHTLLAIAAMSQFLSLGVKFNGDPARQTQAGGIFENEIIT